MKRVRKMCLIVLALACGATTAYAANLKPGSLDHDYGHRGIASADLSTARKGNYRNLATDAVVDKSGRLLIAGSRRANNFDSAVVAFGPDGKVDRGWGENGHLIHRFTWQGDYTDRSIYAADVAIGPRDRVYTADVVNFVTKRDWKAAWKEQEGDPEPEEVEPARVSYYIYAHTSSGRPIRSFGKNGRSRILASRIGGWQDSPDNTLFDLKVAKDGSIFMLYRDRSFLLRVIKLKPNGRVDTTFGVRGRKTLPMSYQMQPYGINAAYLFVSGSKVLVTYAINTETNAARVVWISTRLVRDGALDPSYGSKGRTKFTWPIETWLPDEQQGFYAIRDRQGRLVLSGSTNQATENELEESVGLVMRITKHGKRDKSFGQNGVYRPKTESGYTQFVYGITQTVDGSYAIGLDACPDISCDVISTQLLSRSGKPQDDWAGAGFTYEMGSTRDIVGMYSAGGRVYQVPVSLRARGAKRERFAALAVRR
jgi:uncharacterized delta-60 repeat protein